MRLLFVLAVSILSLSLSENVFALPKDFDGFDLVQGQKTSVKKEAPWTVVVFLSSKCPCSDSHLTELKALAKDYPQIEWVGLHSNMDESVELAQSYFKKSGLPFPVLQDEKAKWADEFKALKTPHAFVLNPQGEILYQGGVSNSHDFAKSDRRYLREALKNLSEGQKVETPVGRTLGCVISRDEKNVW